MSIKKNLLTMLLIVAMLFSLTACGSNDAVEDGTPAEDSGDDSADVTSEKLVFVVPYEGDPGTADVAKTTAEYGLPLNIFDRLVESVTIAPGESELVPGLAESWEVDETGTVYTFHIREGAMFHNGDEVKASDVAYTFDRMLNPATEGLNTDFFDMIVGADARLNSESDSTEGLNVVDDYTLEITIEEPYAPFIAGLATPAGSVYSEKATEAAGEQFGVDPELTIGSGPFKMEEWVVNDKIVMSTFEDYWRGRAQYDELQFKIVPDPETARMMFEKGDLDFFDLDMARSQIPYFTENDKWNGNIVSGPRVGLYYYCINQSIEPLDDVRVRKAIQMSINRENILEKMYFGKGQIVNGVMPPGLYGYNSDISEIEYNPEKAKELLAEAGYPDGFDMTIAQVSDSPTSLKINEVVQAELLQVGMNVTIEQSDSSTFYGIRKTGELPMYLSDWSADFNDPDNFIYTFFAEGNTIRRSFNYANTEVQADIETARTMTDPEARIELYQEIEEKIVHEDAAWIPLFELEHLFVLQPYVQNYEVAWNGWSNQSYYSIEIDK